MAAHASHARHVRRQHRLRCTHSTRTVLYWAVSRAFLAPCSSISARTWDLWCSRHSRYARHARPQACVARGSASVRWASERAALRLYRRVRCAVDYTAHPHAAATSYCVNTARDSFHPRWQPTSAFALKTLKVGIAEISSSDLIPTTSSVLNFVNTHDLAKRGETSVWAVPQRGLRGCTATPERPCGPAPEPIVLPCASARAPGAAVGSALCMHAVWCAVHMLHVLRSVLLAHLGVHGRCGLARRTPSCVGIDDDDLACRIRLAQRVLPLVYAL